MSVFKQEWDGSRSNENAVFDADIAPSTYVVITSSGHWKLPDGDACLRIELQGAIFCRDEEGLFGCENVAAVDVGTGTNGPLDLSFPKEGAIVGIITHDHFHSLDEEPAIDGEWTDCSSVSV